MVSKNRENGKDYVLKMAKEHDVKFIRLWFTDILGVLKSFAITVGELEEALENGMGFDGSSIEGFARIDESDMVAMPDPDTFMLLPWRPKEHRAVARMFCDVLKPGGEPFEGDPRYVLKRNLKKAADLGYTFYVGPELEYFYFKQDPNNTTVPTTQVLDKGGYFDLTPLDAAVDNCGCDQHECGAPLVAGHVRKPPDVTQPDRRSGGGQHKPNFRTPLTTVGWHWFHADSFVLTAGGPEN